jgi:hypothetical protein
MNNVEATAKTANRFSSRRTDAFAVLPAFFGFSIKRILFAAYLEFKRAKP